MKFKTIPLIVFISYLTLNSCTETTANISDKNQKSVEESALDSINKLHTNLLIQKYNAINDLDEQPYYTYHIQDEINTKHQPIRIIGRITDIIKEGKEYVLNVRDQNKKMCLAKIKVDSILFKKMESEFKTTEKVFNDYCFIVNVNDIKSSSPVLSSESDEDGGGKLTYDYRHTITYFIGNLIDYYKYEEK